ncbi:MULTISPECIES: DUF1146 family protein [unclassified Lactobacillus]|uniref:DUF1146 family protein n=1 Tax=unclassified Lactobacillus TaxID=2620435 RepID=UPI000EFBFCCB|nr:MULTISPECIES: DUF1146 family protein [unclassified Lactobacillus]RMC25075.1 DUF1146 domain-containing protein [Lactobacillus sp. ESL0247]RMC29230.1 DUF1146 domain-containing protein [Lactobacillus sp. ESL0246]RMC32833.1 DUF1146 domain-containing protein [Lactobacillus sp. ESL0245]RMC49783.1 DUF1146 domain-containing protein [Lactobacillus sp. ESL0228]
MFQLGVHALISIFIYLLTIGLSFQIMKSIQIEKIIRINRTFEAQLLLVFLSIGLGYLVGTFFITLIDTSLQLSNLF